MDAAILESGSPELNRFYAAVFVIGSSVFDIRPAYRTKVNDNPGMKCTEGKNNENGGMKSIHSYWARYEDSDALEIPQE